MHIDEVEGVGIAEEQHVVQQQASVEQQVKATVLHDLSQQLAELKKEGVDQDHHLHVSADLEEQQHASEPVSVDAADRIRLVEDLTKLSTRVDGISEAARACIDELRETERFFSENALEQMRDKLPLEMQDRETERQRMDNQEQVFATERTLVQTFALNEETTIDEVTATRETWQQQYDDVSARLGQNPPLAEQFDLERQSVKLCNDIDYYECLERVAAQAAYNEQCAQAHQELQQQGLGGPVLLNEQGLPIQRFGTNEIGPAYASQQQAEDAAQAEYERRLAEANTEKKRQEVDAPHVLQIEIRDQNEKVLNRWWEVSELDQNYSEGHTEQKAANRIDFEAMKERDYQLFMVGMNPPCPWDTGCMALLEGLHQKYDIDIEYQARDRHYQFVN